MVLPIVEDVLRGHSRIANDGAMAHFLHGHMPCFCMVGVDDNPGVLHEAICDDGSVTTPLAGPQFAGLAEPGVLKTILFRGARLHEVRDVDAQRAAVGGIEERQGVKKSVALASDLDHAHGLRGLAKSRKPMRIRKITCSRASAAAGAQDADAGVAIAMI